MGWALLRPRNPIQISCHPPLPCHQCPCQIVTFNAHLLTIKTNLSFDNNGQFQTSLGTLFSAHYQYVRWDFKLLEQYSQVFKKSAPRYSVSQQRHQKSSKCPLSRCATLANREEVTGSHPSPSFRWVSTPSVDTQCWHLPLSLIHIWRCRRLLTCRSRWSPYH